jgi:hypothetical protein
MRKSIKEKSTAKREIIHRLTQMNKDGREKKAKSKTGKSCGFVLFNLRLFVYICG